MTRQEYMEELKKYLKRLPQEDFDNAIEYFSEYFEEAGPEKRTVSQSFAGERRKGSGYCGRESTGLKRKETFSGQDHSSCIPGSMCITGQPGTSGICFCSAVCGDPHCCGSDFFDWYYRHCGDSRRYCDHRGWGLFDPEICCSSLYDGRRWIPDDGNWNPRRSFDCIYLQMVCKWDRTSGQQTCKKEGA